MFVVSGHNTLANAQPYVPPTSRRDRVIALARSWHIAQEKEADARARRTRLENSLFPVPGPRTSTRRIIAQVAFWHGLTVAHILGRSRTHAAVRARQDAMAAVRLIHTQMSLPAIGRVFDRDHTTVLHALQKLGVPTSAGSHP